MYFNSFNQTEKDTSLYNKILNLDYENSEPRSEKLKIFYHLKTQIENTRPLNDSAYILDLLKISKYEFFVHNDYRLAITFANNALRVAADIKRKSLKPLIVSCYYNIASSYQNLMLYKQALNYYDTIISLCDRNFIDIKNFHLDALFFKVEIYRLLGDYQKIIDDSNEGISVSLNKKDSSYLVYFLNRKAQSLSYINSLNRAFINVSSASNIAKRLDDQFELATSYKTLGFIYEKKNILDSAEYYFKESIKIRNVTNEYEQICRDYIDLGNFYLNSLGNYKKAELCYHKSSLFADKIPNTTTRNLQLALSNLNLGENYLLQKSFTEATKYLLQSFRNLQINLGNNLQNNPATFQLDKISNKDLVIILMNDKAALLLEQYKTNHDKTFLNACVQTSIVTDSIITQIRHEQFGEQSKLYWRDKTRDFYTIVLEACYLANKPDLAFYFMEKSRAVLLNDKLNELGASSYLSKTDAARQEDYEIKIIELEQKFSGLSDSSKQYQIIQLQLLDAKNNFAQFIKSLEQKYPAYYQYKYADAVPSLKDLQSYLAKNNQSFVHYFLGDTVTYILAITANSTKFIRLSQKDFNKEQAVDFLQLCANKEALMNNYSAYIKLSNSIYKKIFQPLQLPKGRIIICADAIVIPFDALYSDEAGNHFLLNDYCFSYVYSARFLLKHFNNQTAKGNFVGFAPVSFSKTLDVNDLKNAADALHASAAYYSGNKLFTHQNATRHNFFDYVSSYSIVSIFSHARADTTDNEPVLYMQDSLIHLSELQLLNNPATKLVILSACQTNVGKTATGEGIYSLARGFATAGIPSVSATLWKADEQTIYAISEKFNQYLSEGMTKDEALQKAKLYFFQNNSGDKMLPYYWANMILIGNTDAIAFVQSSSNLTWRIIAAALVVMLAFIFIFTRRKILTRKRLQNKLISQAKF